MGPERRLATIKFDWSAAIFLVVVYFFRGGIGPPLTIKVPAAKG